MRDNEEFKYDRSSKISYKEKDLLLQDVIDAYDLNQSNLERENANNTSQNISSNSMDFASEIAAASGGHQNQYQQQPPHMTYTYPSVFNYELTNDQRLLIAQQMRQHIQLITQMSLLTSNSEQWSELHNDCQNMMNELMNRSFNQQYSMYAQDNLFPSINLLSEWDHLQKSPTDTKIVSKRPKLNPELIEFMSEKSAFIYPELLPIVALRNNYYTNSKTGEDKVFFAKGEDDLIALGLEHFYGGTDKWKVKSNKGLTDAYNYISSSIMRGKTVKQLRLRVKNRKDKCRKNEPNAIIYYFQHNQAPRDALNELQTYDANCIVAPKYLDPQKLPEVWREVLRKPLFPGAGKTTYSSAVVTCQDQGVPLFTVRYISSI